MPANDYSDIGNCNIILDNKLNFRKNTQCLLLHNIPLGIVTCIKNVYNNIIYHSIFVI